MKETPYKLSVITVNYNGLDDTTALIESLRRWIHCCEVEIIVVDNASRVDETLILRQRFPDDAQLILIRSERNLGFAGGNNLGIRAATAPYLFLLNNDTYVEEDTLHYLIERLASDPKIGAVSPKIRFAAPLQLIQFAGYTPLSRITLRNALIGFGHKDQAIYQQPHTTPYCHGAAMMFKREIIEQAGEMPTCYFLYYEELDWSVRITRAGYTLWYEPAATVFHKESRSTGRNSPLRTYYLTRNRLLFAKRNLKPLDRCLSTLYQLFIAAPKGVVCALLHGDREGVAAVVRGCMDFTRMKT